MKDSCCGGTSSARLGLRAAWLSIVLIPLLALLGMRFYLDEDFWLKRKVAFLPSSSIDYPVGFGHRIIRTNIDRAGRLSIDERSFTPAQFSDLLQNVAERYGTNVPVVLLANGQTEWKFMLAALRPVLKAGIDQVGIAVRRPDGFPALTITHLTGSELIPPASTNSSLRVLQLNTNSPVVIDRLACASLQQKPVTDQDVLYLECGPELTLQNLVVALDLVERAKRQGREIAPCLVVTKEPPAQALRPPSSAP